MKNKLLRIGATLGFFSLFVVLPGCEKKATKLAGRPDGRPHGIIIHVTDENPDIETNWDKIKDKLAGHEKIFHIRHYRQGQDPIDDPSGGALPKKYMQNTIDYYDTIAENSHFNGHAIQIGLGMSDPCGDSVEVGSPEPVPSPSPEPCGPDSKRPTMPHPHLSLKIKESEKLVREIEPLLPPHTSPIPGQTP